MIIKKLEIQGFKSFPERTRIVFHSGITAIVGPNGTGKSNIVDSILWVLGGHRQKGVRGEKIDDIIFNGNAKKPPLGMADVTLSLEDHQEETVINHRVFRSGESEYRLNGKAARLKDIQDTLWKRAVAEKEYFVIEQGAIGSLLTAKPAEKRTLLEEAAGTAFYKDKKKEAQSKLASSEQNLIRLEDIISEVGRAKNSLQRQAQAAVRYRKLRERIRELTGLNFRRRLEQLERRHEETARHYNDILAQEKELVSLLKTAEKELSDRRREIWELEKFLKESQEVLFALGSQLDRTEAEKSREARRIETLFEKGKRAAASAEEISQDLKSLTADIGGRESSLVELDVALRTKKEEMARAEAESRSVRESFAGREGSIAALKNGQLDKLAALTELRNEAVKNEKELELGARQEARLKAQLDQAKTDLQAREEKLAAIQKSLAETVRAKEEAGGRVAELARAIEESDSAIARLNSRLEEVRKAKEEDRFHLQAVRKLAESQRGAEIPAEIPEVLGRLSELIETDSESAALVDALWAEEAASAVIPAAEFLKRAGEREIQGRFLLITPKPEEPESDPAIEDPRILGSLKSRLRPDSRIKGALGRLRDAVIVKDIMAAIELWLRFPALNFVTAKGDLLLSSGLLRLGRKEEGAFVLGREIKRLEDRIAARDAETAPLSSELEEKNRERNSLDESRRTEAARAEEMGIKVHGLDKELIAQEAERDRTASVVSLLEKELTALNQDGGALRLSQESLTEKIRQAEGEARTLRERLAAEEQEFLAGQGKTVEEEKRFIELRAEAALLEERHGNLDRQVRELAERKESFQRKILALRQENETAEAEQNEAQKAVAELGLKLRNLEEEKRGRQAGLTQKEAELEGKRADEVERDRTLAVRREELERKKEDRVRWEVAKAEIDRDLVNLEETCWQELKKTLHEVKNERPGVELSDVEIEEQLAQADEDLQKYKSVNLMAEEEYQGHKERYEFLVQQKSDLRESIDATQEAIRRIDEESQTQFLNALAEVNKNFQEVFTLLFKGGTAEVKLVEEANPMESGVEINAQPPGKKVQHIMLLSGGEKSLTSIAFMFALFRYKPTPFCILDEVDAALDDVNLTRFLDLMKNIKIDTQFIIITHNYKTMEVADYIYGTTMAEPNFTTLYSVKLEKEPELVQ